MKYQRALKVIASIHQDHLLKYWEDLSHTEKEKLANQIEALDLITLEKQKQILSVPQIFESHHHVGLPLKNYAVSGNLADFVQGKSLIASGQVGCLVAAGGQGTRLRFEGPKGMCPVTLVKKKSLFQLISEKTIAASKQAGRPLALAIMTSPDNHGATLAYFESHNYFGLEPSQVTMYSQKELPLLDKRGNLFLESRYKISEGPDGNGNALYEFFAQGIWTKWMNDGIRFVNFILVDNPLADPFDAELIGFHHRMESDIIVKATHKKSATEKVGILIQEGNKLRIIEYSELPDKEKESTDASGRLRYPIANTSLFSFTMEFIKKIATSSQQMPLHRAFKAVKYLNSSGETVLADAPMAWKFERFIFDLLPMAETVDALVYPREVCFAPLKNFNGNDSLETVPYAIESLDRRILDEITGNKSLSSPLEIAQDFYYPKEELLKTWKGRKITEGGYIITL